VVLVNVVRELLVQDAVDSYRRVWDQHQRDDLLTSAFGCWLGLTKDPKNVASEVIRALRCKTGAQRSYKDAATAGFIAAVDSSYNGITQLLRKAIDWLVRRQTSFEGVPTGVVVDGIAVLGITVGTKAVGDAELTRRVGDWVSGFLPNSVSSSGIESWKRVLMNAAGDLVGVDSTKVKFNEGFADVVIALIARGIMKPPQNRFVEAAAAASIRLLRSESAKQTELERVALRLAAYEWINVTTAAIARPIATVQDVYRVLRNIDRVFYRWTWEDAARTRGKDAEPRKWHIDNEYHLQNLLWVVLGPLFPDLKEEEFVSSVGQLQPRVDIVIPSLHLVIEAKFIYKRTTPKVLIEQIAADNSLYLQRGSQYRSILPVIWDDAARTEAHPMMIQGLKKLTGVAEAIILSRPAIMRELPSGN
jgi:hypothetical protein